MSTKIDLSDALHGLLHCANDHALVGEELAKFCAENLSLRAEAIFFNRYFSTRALDDFIGAVIPNLDDYTKDCFRHAFAKEKENEPVDICYIEKYSVNGEYQYTEDIQHCDNLQVIFDKIKYAATKNKLVVEVLLDEPESEPEKERTYKLGDKFRYIGDDCLLRGDYLLCRIGSYVDLVCLTDGLHLSNSIRSSNLIRDNLLTYTDFTKIFITCMTCTPKNFELITPEVKND